MGKARNREILIPIDAARSGDLENRGFGQKLQDNHRKINVFLFGGAGGWRANRANREKASTGDGWANRGRLLTGNQIKK